MKLIVSEKPSVANNIANVLLGNSTMTRKEGYILGNEYIITWCYGHLISLAQPEVYDDEYKSWNYEQLPIIPDNWITTINPDTLQQYNVISQLMHDERVDSVVNCCDPGREGELIFRYVYDRCMCTKPIQRLWTASLEDDAIREGFKNLKSGRDMENLYKAAISRGKADWLVGMNLTRLFTVVYKAGGKNNTLNIGRVMTPTLAMIVERENQIKNFVKKPFYSVLIETENGLKLKSDRIDEKPVAETLCDTVKGKNVVITDVIEENKSVKPPLLYDLTSLQRDANRLFGYTAAETMDLTQSLYEKKICSYPRTDSRFLSDDMEETALKVLDVIYEKSEFDKKVENPEIKRILDSSKVTDHHAIIPTVSLKNTNINELPVGERKILALLMTRLVVAVAEKHTYKATKVVANCEGNEFTASGKVITNEGFKAYEELLKSRLKAQAEEKNDDDEDTSLPEVSKNDSLVVSTSSIKEGSTQPPKHFTEDTLLAAMERAGADEMEEDVERKGLGTTATRAETIEKLVECNFCQRDKKNILPTDRGVNLISILPDIIKTPSVTAEWENRLAEISRGDFDADDFMEGIKTLVSSIVTEYNVADPDKVDLFATRREVEILGKCPNCGEDVINGPHGAYCSKRCGMMLGMAFGVKLSASQVKSLLENKKTTIRGCKTKDGKTFNANVIPKGIKPYNDGFVYDFEMVRDALGKCPNCGEDVMAGEHGAYCSKKCGMMFGYVFGVKPTTAQVKSLLANKKTLITGCKNKEGKVFDAYFTPKGVKPYKDNFVWDFAMEFPKKD